MLFIFLVILIFSTVNFFLGSFIFFKSNIFILSKIIWWIYFIYSIVIKFKDNFVSGLIVKIFTLSLSVIVFLGSLFIWVCFDNTIAKFQFIIKIDSLDFLLPIFFGIDGISLFFIILTTLILPVCLLANWSLTICEGWYFYTFCLFFIEFLLIFSFTSLDLLIFYFFFESILIPMFFIIGIWGSRGDKIRAAYFFIFYTLIGSFFLLWAILLIYSELGSTQYWVLIYSSIAPEKQFIIWFCFFFIWYSTFCAFSVKNI